MAPFPRLYRSPRGSESLIAGGLLPTRELNQMPRSPITTFFSPNTMTRGFQDFASP
jgi:hypothetical protein